MFLELHALAAIRNHDGKSDYPSRSFAVRLSEIRSVLDSGPFRTIMFIDGSEQDVEESYAAIINMIDKTYV
jgi:hypothetical protein